MLPGIRSKKVKNLTRTLEQVHFPPPVIIATFQTRKCAKRHQQLPVIAHELARNPALSTTLRPQMTESASAPTKLHQNDQTSPAEGG